MTHLRAMLVACTIAAAAIVATEATTAAASQANPDIARAGELSAAKQTRHALPNPPPCAQASSTQASSAQSACALPCSLASTPTSSLRGAALQHL